MNDPRYDPTAAPIRLGDDPPRDDITLCRHVCPRCGGCDICCANPYVCRYDNDGDDS